MAKKKDGLVPASASSVLIDKPAAGQAIPIEIVGKEALAKALPALTAAQRKWLEVAISTPSRAGPCWCRARTGGWRW